MSEHVIPALATRDREKSCADCPMMEVASGGQVSCRVKKIPLTFPSWGLKAQEIALQKQAKDCPWHGYRRLPNELPPASDRLPVIFPVGRAKVLPVVPRLSGSRPVSCYSCKHFVTSDDMNRAHSALLPPTISGVCGAKGLPIPLGEDNEIAGDCLNYEYGNFPVEGLPAILFTPEYSEKYLTRNIKEKSSTHLPEGFDPLTYPTELKVEALHSDNGVRAWVGISDPKTSNKVYLPIYDRKFFPSQEQAKIPNSDDETLPGDYVDHAGLVFKIAVAWMELDETPALIGEAGNGKTEILRHLAWIMQVPFERITITASSEIDDLAGKFVFEDGETVFKYGRLARAWGKVNVVCLDEPNTGPNDVLQFIRPLIDNSKQLVLDQNKGEQIFRNDGCYLGLAMNPAFDYRNIGANQMADADNSRLLHIDVPLPPEHVERKIIIDRLKAKDGWTLPDELLSPLMSIASTLRQMSKDGEVPFSWGIRVQIKVARLLRWFDFHDAFLMAMGSSVDPETQDKIIAVVKSNTPEKS